MAAIPTLKLVAPTNKKRIVGRKANAKYRTREHLKREVERLIEAAKDNRWGHRDSTMVLIAFRHGLRVSELVDLRRAGGPKRRRPARPQSQTGHTCNATCPFRKFHPTQIRIVRQNHRIIESNVYNPARARNVCRGSIQVAEPA